VKSYSCCEKQGHFFQREVLVGMLISILGDDEQTVILISSLSAGLTGKGKLNT